MYIMIDDILIMLFEFSNDVLDPCKLSVYKYRHYLSFSWFNIGGSYICVIDCVEIPFYYFTDILETLFSGQCE